MKVIFLDIDGVMASTRSCVALGGYPHPPRDDWHFFDPVAIGLLSRVVRKTGAVCVLSSTWRGFIDGTLQLSQTLRVPIIDKTRWTIGHEKRGLQIQDWLDAHPQVEAWAILDDDSDMLEHQMDRFVKVDYEEGLSYANHNQLIDLLGYIDPKMADEPC